MKPLGRKNYGSIGHLSNSRRGPADHSVHEGQERICTSKARDKHDLIIVMEKLDGSNVGIARVGDRIYALGRTGRVAKTSKYEQHQMFDDWVHENDSRWSDMLRDGERLVGEWLAQAHGTLYKLPFGPFVAFDLMVGESRKPFAELVARCAANGVPMPQLLHIGTPIPVAQVMAVHGRGLHGADAPEGVVYRVERRREFDFMAKWVRPDKIDGKFLPGVTGSVSSVPVWNWRPSKSHDRKGPAT